jgi:hypothetical protein
VAPVIRISDEVFRKLQRLSEPLVDTPNSVIERLLDHKLAQLGASQGPLPETPQPAALEVEEQVTPAQGVFLAPANQENIARTIESPVQLSDLAKRLDQQTFESIRARLNGKTSFRCWASTVASRGAFDNMRTGDLVLLSPKGTGLFTYRARVTDKIESQALGDSLWPIVPNRSWALVYLLDDVRPIRLEKERLVAEFGYDRGFPVYGITRVSPERLESAIARRGSLEKVLQSASAD